jgi:tetratricopeptide (TPR) repeat protein
MRIAIVAASSYSSSGKLAHLSHAEPEVEALSQRLTEPDAGFYVHLFGAQRGLAEGIEQLVGGVSEPIEALLFYFSGYAVVSDERGPALLLDGERLGTLSLKRLARTFRERAPATLAVLDTVSAFNGQKSPADFARNLSEAFADPRIHVLTASRPEAAVGPSPFSSLLSLMLDWQAGPRGMTVGGLYAAMRAEEALFSEIPAVHFVPRPAEFQLLIPGSPALSIAPPSIAPPSGDEAELRADAQAASGAFDAALEAYGLALEHLGPPPSDRHPPLYSKIGRTLRKADRRADALAYFRAALEIEPNRAEALVGSAEIVSADGDAEGALAMLHRCLTADPNRLDAAELAAKLLEAAQRWSDLASLYEFVLPRVTEPKSAVELSLRLADLCQNKLGDPGRASGPLERAAKLAPAEPRLRQPLSQLSAQRGDHAHALNHVLALLRAEPGRVDEYRTAMRLFEQCGRPDAAWNAACALEVLGEADVNESLLAHTHRPDGLLPARGSLTEAEWKSKSFCPERPDVVDGLLGLFSEAAMEVGFETARRKRRLPSLDPSQAQDPTKSTATLAKTLFWAARLLGCWVPKLYIVADLETTFSIPALVEPTICASKALGSGLELQDLAFLWGRQLALLRPEHRAYWLYPTLDELDEVVEAALSLAGASTTAFRKLDGEAKLFARGLKRHLGKSGLAALEALAPNFASTNSAAIREWSKSVERAAGRAGLLCSGDLERAARLTERFPLPGLVSSREQVEDLLAFSISDEYARLRVKLGVAVQA